MGYLPELVPEDEAGMGWSWRTVVDGEREWTVLGDLDAVSHSARWARAGEGEGEGKGRCSVRAYSTVNYAEVIVQIHS
jgi:hypothetical protein